MIILEHPHIKLPQAKKFFSKVSNISEFYHNMKHHTSSSNQGSHFEIYCEFFLKRYVELLPGEIEHVYVAPECHPGYDFHFFNTSGKGGIIECKWKCDLNYRFAAPELASFVNEINHLKIPKQQSILFTNVKHEKPFTQTVMPKFDNWFSVINGAMQQQFISNDRFFWKFLNESISHSKKAQV